MDPIGMDRDRDWIGSNRDGLDRDWIGSNRDGLDRVERRRASPEHRRRAGLVGEKSKNICVNSAHIEKIPRDGMA